MSPEEEKGLRRYVRDADGRFADVPGSGGGESTTPELGHSDQAWLAAHTVDVTAADLRRGDHVLLAEKIHEVLDARPDGDQHLVRTRDTETGEVVEHRVERTSLWKRLLLGISALAMLVAAAVAGMGVVHGDPAHHDAPVRETTSQVQQVAPAVHHAPHVAAPTTAAGYQRMFDQVPVSEWGGADVSITAQLKDGRHLWLYGDTLSGNNGFVHSTAIVQDGGSLHVSHGGQQLLPNGETTADGRQTVYWIEKAVTQADGSVKVFAAPMSIGKASPWDFKRATPQSRVARVTVDAKGDATFTGWLGYEAAPKDSMIDHGNADFQAVGPHHFTYQGFVHRDIELAGGGHLKTVSQNWDDSFDNHRNPDGSLRFQDWRPLFQVAK